MNAILGINLNLVLDEAANYERQCRLQLERLRIRQKSVFQLPNYKFWSMFRMHKYTFAELMHVLSPHLREPQRSDGIQNELKVAATVRFLAQGSYQMSVGRDLNFGLAQPTISKVMKEVLAVMNEILCPMYIRFPTTNNAKERIKTWFLHEHGIPNVIGIIDGTQIGIYPPFVTNDGHPEHIYVNRKNFHAINVQVIVDHEYRITNINSKFPGSAHNLHIWRMSAAREHLSNVYCNNHEWILGDSGYPLERWLIIPFSPPQNNNEVMFNNLFAKAQNVVEQAIGLLKARWRCLCKQRMLHYSPTVARKIINACAALHNFCMDFQDEFDEPFAPDEPDNDNGVVYGVNHTLQDVGGENREQIIQFMRQFV